MVVGVVLANEEHKMAVVEEHREVVSVHLVGIRSAHDVFLRFLVEVL